MKQKKISLKALEEEMRLTSEEIAMINGGFVSACKTCTCCCNAKDVDEFKSCNKAGKKLDSQLEIQR